MAHEIIALQIATLLLEEPTDDSVELTCTFMQECGFTLNDVTPQGLNAVFERLRGILHEGTIDKRVQCAGSGHFCPVRIARRPHAGTKIRTPQSLTGTRLNSFSQKDVLHSKSTLE